MRKWRTAPLRSRLSTVLKDAVANAPLRSRLSTSRLSTLLKDAVANAPLRSRLSKSRLSKSRLGTSRLSDHVLLTGPEERAGLEQSQIESPGSPSMTCWRSTGRSPGFQSDAVCTTR